MKAGVKFRRGEVTEWLKVPLSKSGLPETVTRVRIPTSPWFEASTELSRSPSSIRLSSSQAPLGEIGELLKENGMKNSKG
jgi:hypothetical protein